ncbi:MAG: excinuclease ABC subunit UvrC [Clostridia bacterium]|nr:excinuclease ABC subunit UvrC [Clostridia bacterium]
MFDIEQELKNLPDQPGVYIMHSADDAIIYIGKAKVLKNRVRQYFQNSSNHTPKVRAMVSNIAYFEYIVTDSEIEALVLECNLIKKHKPRYNILLKDDKHYPYIKVTVNDPYPRIMMTRRILDDGARYFGPYTGSNTIRNTLDVVQNIFNHPTCRRKFPEDIGRGRPCLNYHIKKCFAPCTGNVTKEQYREIFFEICSFLEGKHTQLLHTLEEEMKLASNKMEFEQAATLRDKINAIRAIEQKQKIINSNKQVDEDIIAFEKLDGKAFAEVFFVRSGKVIGRENYRVDNAADMSDNEIMTEFVQQFYARAAYIPQIILLEHDIDDKELVKSWLAERRGKSVTIEVPKRGEKKKLVELVKKNAGIAADNYKINKLKEEEKHNVLAKLAECLGLEKEPARIESYDISNISGSENVGAMVVFRNGFPDRQAYRKFKIKGFEGADDYGAICEVLYRRFRRALEENRQIETGEITESEARFLPLPDVIFVDGGKGHVRAAQTLLDEIGIEIPVFGMVKDDKHRTRAMVSPNGEIEISMISNVFNFITRIQDEVHKTAITYHRELHRKNAVKSELDGIRGIGPKKRAALLSHFKSVENIKNADMDALLEAVDRVSAENVWKYFHNEA